MIYGISSLFNTGMGSSLGKSSPVSSAPSNIDWQSVLSGGLGGLSSLLLGNNSGADQIQNYLQQGQQQLQQNYNQAQQYLSPYQTGGQQAYSQYQDWLDQMQNPEQYYNNIMNQYSLSPAAQFQMQQGTEAANRSAAAAGNVGTPAAQKALMRYSQGLTNQDMQTYFNNIMGVNNLYGGGLNTLNQMGYGASGLMSQNAMGYGSELAQLLSNMGLASGYGQKSEAQGLAGALGGAASIASLFF